MNEKLEQVQQMADERWLEVIEKVKELSFANGVIAEKDAETMSVWPSSSKRRPKGRSERMHRAVPRGIPTRCRQLY